MTLSLWTFQKNNSTCLLKTLFSNFFSFDVKSRSSKRLVPMFGSYVSYNQCMHVSVNRCIYGVEIPCKCKKVWSLRVYNKVIISQVLKKAITSYENWNENLKGSHQTSENRPTLVLTLETRYPQHTAKHLL